MNRNLEKAEDRFIEYVGRLCESFGLNHFLARLYAVLYLNGDKMMSLDEMADRLKVSKGNVSVNIRILENWGVVSKAWVKGSRKDYYNANPNIEKALFEKVRSAVTKRLDSVSEMIEEFKATVDAGHKEFTPDEREIARIHMERVRKIENIKNMAEKLLAVVDTTMRFK